MFKRTKMEGGGGRLMQGKNVQANGQLFFQLALVK